MQGFLIATGPEVDRTCLRVGVLGDAPELAGFRLLGVEDVRPREHAHQIAIRVVNRESLVAGARGARGEPGTLARVSSAASATTWRAAASRTGTWSLFQIAIGLIDTYRCTIYVGQRGLARGITIWLYSKRTEAAHG